MEKSGFIHREGKTLMRLPSDPRTWGRGPRVKGSEDVFYNPSMAGSRTRSVLLFKHAIERGFFGDGPIYAIDGLCASGLRARRWINELPRDMSARISATIVEMDPVALDWAMSNHLEYPPDMEILDFIPICGDFRSVVMSSGRHWIDVDPYGSPIPFLDSCMQSLARSSVLEVSATDTAALAGSSKRPLLRRYGARICRGGLAHDSGLRVMLSTIARVAAKHDRCIEPLLSIWDSHHLRASVRVTRSIDGANDVERNLGWRVHSPTHEEVSSSIESGLHHVSSLEQLPMNCFLPIGFPIELDDPRISGPMWIGSMGDFSAMSSMTPEMALELCGPTEVGDPLNWEARDFEYERRRIVRSVKNICDEAEAIGSHNHIIVDELASWLHLEAPPSPAKMVSLLREMGQKAGLTNYGLPSFRTDSPWERIVEVAKRLQPPM